MSRIGRLPITVPAGVTVEIAENNKVTVKGPKGTLVKELPRVLGGLGTAIISTNQGVITDKEARKLQIGGEVLCFVW